MFFRDESCSIGKIDWDKKFDFWESFRNTSSYRGFRGVFANLSRPAFCLLQKQVVCSLYTFHRGL